MMWHPPCLDRISWRPGSDLVDDFSRSVHDADLHNGFVEIDAHEKLRHPVHESASCYDLGPTPIATLAYQSEADFLYTIPGSHPFVGM